MQIIRDQKQALDILLQQEPLVIFQGKSEWGPRALGNRSILFDPTNKNAKHIINKIKGRQWWRPTAATIMLEHKDDWFDFATLKESPYMSFAVDAKPQALEKVPAVVHVNNTCRVQTLTSKQNRFYYQLIKAFYNKTQVPMLLNTSFNLAGFPMVEDFKDATHAMLNSSLEFIYVKGEEQLC
tara:strand:+ start:431 stop:976 length:546 start_codon:yes stop_codon:yes gene_type:complete